MRDIPKRCVGILFRYSMPEVFPCLARRVKMTVPIIITHIKASPASTGTCQNARIPSPVEATLNTRTINKVFR